jgi:hypothetical protein
LQEFEEGQRALLDVQALAGELLAPASAFAFLAEHRARLFPDSMIEALGDSAYRLGEMLETLEIAGHEAAMTPELPRPASAEGFILDGFTYDEESGPWNIPTRWCARAAPGTT